MLAVQILCLFLLIVKCESTRILAVFPTPAYSHHEMFRQFTLELAKRGHQVVVITPFPFLTPETSQNITEIDVHDVTNNVGNYVRKEFEKSGGDAMIMRKLCLQIPGRLFEAQIQTEQVQHLLKDNKQQFDLIIAEAIIRPVIVLSHIYNAPVIQMSSFGGNIGIFISVGAAVQPFIFPTETGQKFQNLTFWDKLTELYNYYLWIREYNNAEEDENKILKHNFGPETPNISELMKNVVLVLLNVHPLWDSNRPVPPNVVYLGTISAQPQGYLSKELQDYLDDSLNDVIYVSFGTNVDEVALTSDRLEMILEVFNKLPYNFLMKWNDKIVGLPKNVKIFNWLPQVDVLRHPKVKIFITQGGFQSIHEAITAGVPIIGIPIMFDQWLNVDKCVQFKIGEQLDINSIDKNNLRNAVEKVMQHKSYHQNIVKLRNHMFDQPEQPMERAIWWTEYVLRHGKEANLKAPSASMSWVDYYEVELVLLFIVTVSAILVITLKLLRWLLVFLLSGKTKTD